MIVFLMCAILQFLFCSTFFLHFFFSFFAKYLFDHSSSASSIMVVLVVNLYHMDNQNWTTLTKYKMLDNNFWSNFNGTDGNDMEGRVIGGRENFYTLKSF